MTLSQRIAQLTGPDNRLDVMCEVALFKPNKVYLAIRANTAGTKVIYTDQSGNDVTCWAEEWTHPARVKSTVSAMMARGL